jgi:hypothetical protein
MRFTQALLIAALSLTFGCSTSSDVELEHFKLDSVELERGLTGRFAMMLPAGPCVVLRRPPVANNLVDIAEILAGDPEDPEDDGEVHREATDSYWRRMTPSHETSLSTFNCCTYAVGDVVRLSVNDWLEPKADSNTFFKVPIEIVLDSYFRMVTTRPSPIDWNTLQRDKTLLDGDVVCFVNQQGQPNFIHVGRILKQDARNWMVSKLGNGPVVRATLQSTANAYLGEFTDVRIYRKNGVVQ